MWSFLGNIALSIAVSAAVFFGLSHAPQQLQHLMGNVSLTTVNPTDNLTNFPTVYNANNTALNNGKVDVGSTSIAAITALPGLSTVGTITSGIWQGTAVSSANGGTGSTTLSINQVLLGNGTGNITTPAGWGNSGQALVSQGAGNAPVWQSSAFDATQNYNFTGTNLFKTLVSSSTIQINNGGAGVNYSFPTSQGGVGTLLQNNGSGSLSWSSAPRYAVVNTVNNLGNGATTATSSPGLYIPAGTMSASSTIVAFINASCAGSNQTCNYNLRDSMTGLTLLNCNVVTAAAADNWQGPLTFEVTNTNGLANQVSVSTGVLTVTNTNTFASSQNCANTFTSTINMANAMNLVMNVQGSGISDAQINGFSITVTP